MHTKEQVERWLLEESKKAIEAGIPISRDIDPKITLGKVVSYYAQTWIRDEKYPDHAFRIRLSSYFLGASENEIRQTLMHELVHTCPNCMNHGSEWRKWISVVNDKYDYEISRIGKFHTFKLKRAASKTKSVADRSFNSKIKYKVMCPNCGIVARRTRRSRLVDHPELYVCGRCHRMELYTEEI